MRRTLFVIGCGLVLWLTACTQAPPPPPDTRAADEKAIRDLESANMKNWAAKDVDKIASFYASDAAVFAPGMKVVTGTDNIKTAIKGFLDVNSAFTGEDTRVEVSKAGDLGYSQGTYKSTMTDPKTKKVMMEEGKYVTAFKKQADGSWKAVADIFNADAPAMAMPAKK